MRKTVVTILFTMLTMLTLAKGQYIKPGNLQQSQPVLIIDDDALTDGVSFSAPVKCGGYNQVALYITYSRDSGAASDVRMQCYGYRWTGTARSTEAYQIQAIDVSVPALLDSVDKLWKKDVSANKSWIWNVPLNYDYFSCSYTATGVTTDDITVYYGLGGI